MDFNYHDLLKDLPSLAELTRIAQTAGLTLKDLINTRSQAYKHVKPDLNALNEAEVYQLIIANPRILTRPLLTDGRKLLLGFDADQYQSYIGKG